MIELSISTAATRGHLSRWLDKLAAVQSVTGSIWRHRYSPTQHRCSPADRENDLSELDDATMAIMTRVLETIRADKKE